MGKSVWLGLLGMAVACTAGSMVGCTSTLDGPNRAPVARAGADQVTRVDQAALLDGSGSFDPDGDGLEYRWELVAGPQGVAADLAEADQVVASLTPRGGGVWLVRLKVSDGWQDSEADVVRVSTRRVCQAVEECDDGEACTDDACDSGECRNDPVTDGTACDDGLWCTVGDACQAGACVGQARDCSAVEDACNASSCDEAGQECLPVLKPAGTVCNDGLWCTETDTCQAGICGGSDRDCSQGAGECQQGTCDEVNDQCYVQDLPEGALCDDGEFCTEGERCTAGVCQGGQPRDCSAQGGGCVDGVCDEQLDQCMGDPLAAGTPCNDGLYCTEADVCDGQGGCASGPATDCSGAGDECNNGICDDNADQCVPDPVVDGLECGARSCSGTDWMRQTCQGGACAGSALEEACEDGLACNGLETCVDGAGCVAGSPAIDGTACDEGVEADGDLCDSSCRSGVCTDGQPPACADGLFCNGAESCIPASGCQGGVDALDGTPCDEGPEADGNLCDSSCQGGTCTDGRPPVCDDGLRCNGLESCDPGSGCQNLALPVNGTACDEGAGQDGDVCNSSCRNGVCEAGQPASDGQVCDDGDPCASIDRCLAGECTAGTTDLDSDGDGYFDEACPLGDDCDDDPLACGNACFPGNPEVCDGYDNDCNGEIDDIYPDWWDLNWSHRKQLSFVNGLQGSTLVGFPVLVVLDNGNFSYADARADGIDLRFISSDGVTELPYHFERWTNGGTSFIWVRVDSIDANSNSDYMWMYYGNPAAADVRDENGTYDANYMGVWHLHETVSDELTGGQHRDSTSNGNHGTQYRNNDVAGKIAEAQDFDGSGDYVRIPHDSSLNLTTSWTIETWINVNSLPGQWGAVVSKDCDLDQSRRAASLWLYQNDVEVWYTPGGNNLDANNVVSPGIWYYLAVTFDNGGLLLYVDGTLDTSANASTPDTNTYDQYFGLRGQNNPCCYLNSRLDEVRISNIPRSADWIAAQYLSMNDNFVNYSAAQSLCP